MLTTRGISRQTFFQLFARCGRGARSSGTHANRRHFMPIHHFLKIVDSQHDKQWCNFPTAFILKSIPDWNKNE